VEEMRNLDQVQQPAKKSLWLMHIIGLSDNAINSKKQASKGLKKIVDDMR
jgi:hypothetical protein